MSEIVVTPLGAGQDVGRSCILLEIGGKNIMLDCGMHMGYNDERRFPDFSYVAQEGSLNEHLDCIIISHFHLDHCGALPYMTEMVGYNGPIYMTHPTKAICPILLEDFRKISVDRKGETNFFTSQMIKDCMRKVVAVSLHQIVQVDDQLEIKAYYAGHVLGAAMFHIRVGSQSVVYTGDYNMTPDRHLGAAWIDKCRPSLLITESTYATTIRDSKRCRERDFLTKVHDCIDRGGKVLIPAFALGRAQELCILLETYWDRMNIKCPIYFAAGLTEKATNYYKMFITWTNQKIRRTFVHHNMFDFKHIKPFDRAYIDNPGPMVVFATPGMLHAGLSLHIFKRWAPFENNMVIMPGYCVAGTVGHKILNGVRHLEIDKGQTIDVKLAVEYMSFSAHADAKGIMQLIRQCEPANVLLVHGEASKMEFLKKKICQEFNIQCFMPANGESARMTTPIGLPVEASLPLLKRVLHGSSTIAQDASASSATCGPPPAKRPTSTKRLLHGVLIVEENGGARVTEWRDAMHEAGTTPHTLRFTATVALQSAQSVPKVTEVLYEKMKSKAKSLRLLPDGSLSLASALIKVDGDSEQAKDICVSWADQDETLGSALLELVRELKDTL